MSAKVATFRERFSTLFDESDKTMQDLSKELHVSHQTISAWKMGTRSPKEPTIITIANHFGVSISWLMGFNVERGCVSKPIGTKEALAAAKIIDTRSKPQREQVLNVIQAMFPQKEK